MLKAFAAVVRTVRRLVVPVIRRRAPWDVISPDISIVLVWLTIQKWRGNPMWNAYRDRGVSRRDWVFVIEAGHWALWIGVPRLNTKGEAER